MHRVLFFWLLVAGQATATVIDSQIFINEFHYDNTGADQDQFVEVVAPTTLADPASVSLTLYNGGTGAAYAGPVSLSDFTAGDVVDGFAFFALDISLQNGGPDGLALANGTQLLQFLSYEGVFTAADGVAQDNESTDVLVTEPTDTPVGASLQLVGQGDSYLDFLWSGPTDHSRGLLNVDQLFLTGGDPDPTPDPTPDPGPTPGPSPDPAEVPEPISLLIWALGVGMLLAVHDRRRPGRLT